MSNLTRELVDRALDGDLDAQGRLVAELAPQIHWSVGKMLRRWRTGPAASRDLRQEVEDMVQEVFLELFEDDGKTLRRWDPERLPLEGFVGYVARIRTAEVLRSRRSPWREEPQPAEDLPVPSVDRTPEANSLSRDELRKVHLCLTVGFQPEDAHLFEIFFLRQASPEEAATATGRSLAAVYKWRSRLYGRARKCRDDVSKKSPRAQRKQGGGAE
jgi:RNA polymerase sigma factor (sigma-70 family)